MQCNKLFCGSVVLIHVKEHYYIQSASGDVAAHCEIFGGCWSKYSIKLTERSPSVAMLWGG